MKYRKDYQYPSRGYTDYHYPPKIIEIPTEGVRVQPALLLECEKYCWDITFFSAVRLGARKDDPSP